MVYSVQLIKHSGALENFIDKTFPSESRIDVRKTFGWEQRNHLSYEEKENTTQEYGVGASV